MVRGEEKRLGRPRIVYKLIIPRTVNTLERVCDSTQSSVNSEIRASRMRVGGLARRLYLRIQPHHAIYLPYLHWLNDTFIQFLLKRHFACGWVTFFFPFFPSSKDFLRKCEEISTPFFLINFLVLKRDVQYYPIDDSFEKEIRHDLSFGRHLKDLGGRRVELIGVCILFSPHTPSSSTIKDSLEEGKSGRKVCGCLSTDE